MKTLQTLHLPPTPLRWLDRDPPARPAVVDRLAWRLRRRLRRFALLLWLRTFPPRARRRAHASESRRSR